MDEDKLRYFNEVIRPRVRFTMRAQLYRMLRQEHGLTPEKARWFIGEMDRIADEALGKENDVPESEAR